MRDQHRDCERPSSSLLPSVQVAAQHQKVDVHRSIQGLFGPEGAEEPHCRLPITLNPAVQKPIRESVLHLLNRQGRLNEEQHEEDGEEEKEEWDAHALEPSARWKVYRFPWPRPLSEIISLRLLAQGGVMKCNLGAI